MYIKSKALRVLGVIGAALLCLPLLLTLMVAPMYSAVSSLLTPHTLTKVVREIDYSELVKNATNQVTSNSQMPAQMIKEVMNTPFAEDLITVYTDELVGILQNGEVSGALTTDSFAALVQSHEKDLIGIIRKHVPEAQNISDEKMGGLLKEMAEDFGEEIVETLPTAEDVALLVPTQGTGPLSIVVSNAVPVALIITILVLAGLTFACLLHRFRGLLWLGIEALVACLPLAVICTVLGTLGPDLLEGTPPSVASAVISALSGNLLTATIVLATVGVVLIAGFIAYRIWKKRQATTGTVPALENEVPEE